MPDANSSKMPKSAFGLKSFKKALAKVFKLILSRLSFKAKASINTITEGIKRKRFFADHNNLKGYHYELINDLAFHVEKRSNYDKSKPDVFGKLWKMIKSMPFLKAMTNLFLSFSAKVLYIIRFNKYYINPNSPPKVLWDLIIMLFTIIQLFSFSIESSFLIDLNMSAFEFCFIWTLCADILITLNTKIYKNGAEVTDRVRLINFFLKNRWLSDLTPCLFIMVPALYPDRAKYKFFNLFLLFKIFKAKKVQRRLKELIINTRQKDALFQLFILVVKIRCWAHLIAVIWHYIGYNVSNPNANSWLKAQGIEEKDWFTKYLFSVYWGVTTMLTVGYGDVTPTNNGEIMYNILTMFVGCGIFGYAMNKIGEILNQYHRKSNYLDEQMSKVSFMLKKKRLPLETQTKIKRYLEFVWKQEQMEDPEHESFIMNKLSSDLRNEIYLHTNVKLLKSVPAFKHFQESTLIMLATCMKKEGEYENLSIYFVLQGNLKLVTTRDDRTLTTWKKYKKDDYFGVEGILSGTARTFGVVSSDFSTLFKLSRSDMIHVLRKFPKEYEKYCQIKDLEILYGKYSQYDTPCYSCNYTDHPLERCQFLRYQLQKNQSFTAFSHSKDGLNDFLELYQDDEDLKELLEYYEADDEARASILLREKGIMDIYRGRELDDPNSEPSINESDFSDKEMYSSSQKNLSLRDENDENFERANSLKGDISLFRFTRDLDENIKAPISDNGIEDILSKPLASPIWSSKITKVLQDGKIERIGERKIHLTELSRPTVRSAKEISFDLKATAQLRMDSVRIFEFYFPHNNISEMLKKLKSFRTVQSGDHEFKIWKTRSKHLSIVK